VAASRFRAMNTDVTLLGRANDSGFKRAFAAVRRTFSEVETSLSRFRDDSELVALNQAHGQPFMASSLLFHAVSLAIAAAEATDGIFDPTVLPALERAGYDRSFELILGSNRVDRPIAEAVGLPDYRTVHCNPDTRTIQLGIGQRIDLGGIGKGLAVDLAMEETAFLGGRCIVAGGDIAARGRSGSEDGWTIALEDAGDAQQHSVLVRDAAVATSSTSVRHWRLGDNEQHHLIDTRTGQPSSSPYRSVTVVAATCVQADVAAKTALLLGEPGIEFLNLQSIHGFAVRHDSSTASTHWWPQSC